LDVFSGFISTGEAENGRWLEPGAGEGNIIYGAKSWKPHFDPIWDACELREECEPILKEQGADIIQIGDYFEKGPPPGQRYSVIMTNPPFRLAQEFIQRSLDADCRYVVMLLRLNYIGSERRNAFMTRHAPDLYVLPNRPSFKATGETDSIEYAWFLWDKHNLNRSFGDYRLLDLTPLEVRRAEHKRLKALDLFGIAEEKKEEAA
jgi:hypothetical protein